ncbi:MAG: hypothetical protein LBR91_03945 [Puniceicoccales bacterium]|jgi:hypothetical protein|nr:hypothetical protein [Puniceicoccales bacterium]
MEKINFFCNNIYNTNIMPNILSGKRVEQLVLSLEKLRNIFGDIWLALHSGTNNHDNYTDSISEICVTLDLELKKAMAPGMCPNFYLDFSHERASLEAVLLWAVENIGAIANRFPDPGNVVFPKIVDEAMCNMPFSNWIIEVDFFYALFCDSYCHKTITDQGEDMCGCILMSFKRVVDDLSENTGHLSNREMECELAKLLSIFCKCFSFKELEKTQTFKSIKTDIHAKMLIFFDSCGIEAVPSGKGVLFSYERKNFPAKSVIRWNALDDSDDCIIYSA